MPQACIFLSGQRINYTRQSCYQFHPGTPVHSQTTPSRMLGGGGKETATLHNHFLSLSPVTTCEEELLSQLCTFSSSSWGRRRGRERPKGKILTKHSKTISNCQTQIHYGHEADWDVQSLSGKSLCWDVLGFVLGHLKGQLLPERGLLPYTGHVAAGTISQFTQNAETQFLLKSKVLIFQWPSNSIAGTSNAI